MLRSVHARKVLAVILVMALLASTLVVGVSAANGNGVASGAAAGEMEAHYDAVIKNGSNDRYSPSSGGDNTRQSYSKTDQVIQTGIGRGNSGGAMRLRFSAAPPEDDTYTAFRLFDQTRNQGSGYNDINKGRSGYWYNVTFWYKVEAPETGTAVDAAKIAGDPVPMSLNFVYGGINWGAQDKYPLTLGGNTAPIKSINLDMTQPTEWKKFTVLFKATSTNGFHVALASTDKALAHGARLLVDDMSVVKVSESDAVTLSFDVDGGAAIADWTVMKGAAIDVAELPVAEKPGYQFLGWEQNGAPVTGSVIPTATVTTLKATYQLTATSALVNFVTNGGTPAMRGDNAVTGPVEYQMQGGVLAAAVDVTTTREGFIFDGWFADKALRIPVTTITKLGVQTLYAGWTKSSENLQTFEEFVGTSQDVLNIGFDGVQVHEFYEESLNSYFYVNRTDRVNYPDADFEIVNGQMRMSYVAGATQSLQMGGFRLTDENGQKVVLTEGLLYKLTFDYAIENAAVAGAVTMLNGSCSWGQVDAGALAAADKRDVLTFAAGSTASGKAELVFKATKADALHLALTTADTANRGGTAVTVDNVKLELCVRDPDELTKYGDATVSNEQNHTADGQMAAKLTASNKTSRETNRVTFANVEGTVKLTVGKEYLGTAWVYADKAITGAKVRFVNDVEGQMSAQYDNKVAAEVVLDLPAKQWVRVQTRFTLKAAGGQNNTEAYVSVGVADPAGGNATMYVDDISIQESVAVLGDEEGYELYDAKNYDANNQDGIHGNGSGREVSNEQNHTAGGAQSLKMNLNRDMATDADVVARTVLKVNDLDFKATVGQGYLVSFWAYSAQGGNTSFCLGSGRQLNFNNDAQQDKPYRNDREDGSTVTVNLPAAQWSQVTLVVSAVAGKGLEAGDWTYLTLNAWFAGASGSNSRFVYVDDVAVQSYVPYTMDPKVQSYELSNLGTNLNTFSTFPMTVTTAMNRTEGGMRSVLFVSGDGSGAKRPQMLLTDGNNENIKIEAGKKYTVTFWVYCESNGAGIKYWLTASAADKVYANGGDKDIYCLVESEMKLKDGEWNQVTVAVEGTDVKNGILRLGIDDEYAHYATHARQNYYIDDVQVTEVKPVVLDPEATVLDYEKLPVGANNSGDTVFVLNGNGMVSDAVNHTEGGGQSLQMNSVSWSGGKRNQTVVLDPATNQPLRVKKGQEYVVSFWVYQRSQDAFDDSQQLRLNWWLCTTEDISKPLEKPAGVVFDYDCGGSSDYDIAPCDTWKEIKQNVVALNDGYVVLGTSDNTNLWVGGEHKISTAIYFIDDIEIVPPKRVTFKFEGNGSDEVYEDKTAIVGQLVPPQDEYPYRLGYEFLGWYLTPDCQDGTLFDFAKDVAFGKDGDVITLYASWRAWNEDDGGSDEEEDDKPLQKPEEEVTYKSETVYNKVWIGDTLPDLFIEAGENLIVNEAEAVVTPPQKNDQPQKPAPDDNGMPGWLLIVIIVAAVLFVGGGATAALLLKKNKA